MLFNSYEFIFAFLPLCLGGYFLCARLLSMEFAFAFLVLASLFFYAWWEPIYVLLILFSIGFNFSVGRVLSQDSRWRSRTVLIFGIATNLGLLGYFKYANFFIDNLSQLLDTDWNIGHIFLPLAISFFTFQQIAYLVDAWQGKTSEYNFLHYCLFVCFFPQLIAGPIVHHKDMLPQFMRSENLTPRLSNFAIGISIFAIGLFKKTVLADSLSVYVGPIFDNEVAANEVDFFRAWGAAVAYTFQLYFDFSGYSDMAVGAARMFGVRLPLNFFSPLKARSMTDLWDRWHMTLSRFLREYLYIALGGNRKGKVRRYVNLFLTMLLGGLWHGAGWPFVLWGALHGAYLIVNHGWRTVMNRVGLDLAANRAYIFACWLLTFVAWVVSLVYFRAPTVERGQNIVSAMFGFSGFEVPAGILVRAGAMGEWATAAGVTAVQGGGSVLVANYLWIIATAPIILLLPNVAQIFHRHDPVLYESDRIFAGQREAGALSWDYRTGWAVFVSAAGVAGVMTLQQVSEFLYFQF
ncbi:MAG: MBOAT family protein [Halioglobus sp.]|nr:MBOAT family protein [Halioglobus sp.]